MPTEEKTVNRDLPAPDATSRAANGALVAALLTLVIGGLIVAVGGAVRPVARVAGPEFTTAIVGFELARSGEDVFVHVGPRDGGPHRLGIARALYVDFAFLFAYPAWQLALVAYVLRASAGRSRLEYVAAALSAVTALGDAVENATMLALMRFDDASAIPRALLTRLDIATCVKWASCFATGLLLAWALASTLRGTRTPKAALVAFVPLAACTVGLASLFVRGDRMPDLRPMVEVAMNGLVLTWFGVTLHAYRFVRRSR